LKTDFKEFVYVQVILEITKGGSSKSREINSNDTKADDRASFAAHGSGERQIECLFK